MAIIAAGGGGTDLYCHSKPPLTSGKLCFIINFIEGATGVAEFLLGGGGGWPPPFPPFEPPLFSFMLFSCFVLSHRLLYSQTGTARCRPGTKPIPELSMGWVGLSWVAFGRLGWVVGQKHFQNL